MLQFHGMLQLAPGAPKLICKSYAVPCVGVANLRSEPDGGAAFSGAVFVGFTLVRGGAGDGLPGTPQAL